MADIELGEITVQRREAGVEGQAHPADEDPPVSTRKGKKNSHKRRDSASGQDLRETQQHGPLISNGSQDHGGVPRGDGNGEPDTRIADGKEKGRELLQEDFRAQFYERYRKEAEEYDKEFMKKHDEDLNTTLIFAGLFSAVTSAFIIQVHPQLQPDPTDESAALLRIMLYKMDNTMFGGNPPPLPQWTGAPRGIIQVQAMLYASLAASLFSAFLAMLGKQWLNRYASTDMRGTAVERSRDRQRKLDGIITWYFDHVMESLPLMLQSALLLLGCALSIYLWEIHVTVACVVVSVTVLGVIFYIFFVVAGAASASCPYQTPGGRALRHIYHHTLHHIYHHTLPHILRSTPSLLYSAFRRLFFSSMFIGLFRRWASEESPYNGLNIIIWISSIPFIPFVLIHDVCHFILAVVKAPIVLAYGVLSRILNRSPHPAQTHRSNQPMAMLDSRCISWILQTSLERGVRLSTLKFLATIPTLVDLDPALVLECFNVLIDCVKVNEGSPAVVQGMEQLGEASAMSFFLTYSHLMAMGPTSSILSGVVQRYERIFPPHLTSGNLPFPHTLGIIHEAIHPGWELKTSIDWTDYEPTNHEHVIVSRALLKLCRFKSKDPRREYNVVPLQFHHFAAHFLTQDSLPSSSIIADCLLILATELHCDVPETTISEESARPDEVSDLIIQKLNTVTEHQGQHFDPRSEPIGVFFSYAIQRERCGDPRFFDAILHFVKANFSRYRTSTSFLRSMGPGPFTCASPQAIILATPHLYLELEPLSHVQELIPKWAAAVSVAPHTEEVAGNVVDALLQIADNHHLRPFIPADVWLWLGERPSLPPGCRGLSLGSSRDIFRMVQGFKDIGLLTSYLILIWSEHEPLYHDGFAEMRMSVSNDFNGVENSHHRAALVQRLDHILSKLSQESRGYRRKLDQYGELRKILQDANQEATVTEILNQSHSTFMCALPLPCL